MADVQYASSAMPTYFPHPPWHPMYSLARDVVEYLLKMHAVDVYMKLKAALFSRGDEGEWVSTFRDGVTPRRYYYYHLHHHRRRCPLTPLSIDRRNRCRTE